MLTELQTQNKLVGYKQSIRAVQSGKVKKVFLALDAETKISVPVKRMCEQNGIELETVSTMKELGAACDINIGAAVAAIVCD